MYGNLIGINTMKVVYDHNYNTVDDLNFSITITLKAGQVYYIGYKANSSFVVKASNVLFRSTAKNFTFAIRLSLPSLLYYKKYY